MNMYLEYGLLIALTFLVVTVLSYILRKSIDLLIKRKSKLINADPTNFIFLKNSITFLLYVIAILWIFHKIPYFRTLGTALFAGAGVLAAIIGFASQKAFANIVGGLFILIFRPFRVGDIIEISNARRGVVEEITLRHTIIRDYEFMRIVIPNSMISEETIINSSITDDKVRKHIHFGISYDSDVDLASQIIREEVNKHPLILDNRSSEEKANNVETVDIKLIRFDDSAVTLRAYAWARNYEDAFSMQCDVYRSIKKRFDLEGIEIPFPHRTLVFKDKQIQTKLDQINPINEKEG